MLIAVVVLIVTNLLSLAGLVWLYVAPIDLPGPDPAAAAALDRSPLPPVPVAADGSRLLISIEILNPIELAGTRGRLAGLAGTIAPRLTRRIVYDQTVKIVKAQLLEQQVVADVRLHTLRPVPEPSSTAWVDTVERIDPSDPER